MKFGLGSLFRCIKNERYIDRESVERLGLGQGVFRKDFILLPRPIKTYKYSKIINFFSIKILFFAITIPLYFLFTLKSLFYFISCNCSNEVHEFYESEIDFILKTHSKVQCLYEKNIGKDNAYIFLTKKEAKKDLSFKESLRMFFAIFCIRKAIVKKIFNSLNNKKKCIYWLEIFFNSYVFEELKVFSRYIENLKNQNNKIYIANHYDRWSVMVDRLSVRYTIFQHGRLVFLDLPYKLRNVEDIYFQNPDSLNLIRCFLSDSCLETVKFIPLQNTLSLQDVSLISRSNKKHLLYIGEPHLRAYEETLLKKLVSDSRIVLIYKPHPRFKHKKFNFENVESFIKIKKASFYPSVDLVIFFGSTLGYEYAESGTKVVTLTGVYADDLHLIDCEIKSIISGK